jgi:hypothetical protein
MICTHKRGPGSIIRSLCALHPSKSGLIEALSRGTTRSLRAHFESLAEAADDGLKDEEQHHEEEDEGEEAARRAHAA